MSQNVTDGFQRRSILQEMEGIRVAQAMWTLVRNAEPASSNQRLKGFRDGSGFQRAEGGAHAQKNSPIWSGRRRPFQMLHERGQDLIGEREFQRRGGLALVDSQDTV